MLRLARERRGVAAVEFAIIAPVLLTIICTTIEMGHLTAVRASLESAIGTAARRAAVSLETDENTRDSAMRTSVTSQMSGFQLAQGGSVSIITAVYRNFGSSYPENFNDTNHNGRYDPATPTTPAESFTDRNNNGKWDPATPVTGKLGGPGDVVSYTATFPSALWFNFLQPIFGQSVTLSATTVLRNEPVVSKAT